MKFTAVPMRLRILLASLVVLCALAIGSRHTAMAHKATLSEIAQENAEELTGDGSDAECRLVGLEVTAARRYGIVGPVTGKVAVYTARSGPSGEQYHGYFYFYERRDNQWVFTESGYCSHGEIQDDARRLDSNS